MPHVRIGCVEYLNTLPLVEGLAGWQDAQLVPAVPARLIDMLLSGQVDLALASVIDAARHAGAVALLPVGMIASDGPTMTVRVFSRVPLAQVRRVCCDTDSHTSIVLLRIIMARTFGADVEVIDYDARGHVAAGPTPGPCEAILLIGDKVVTDPPPTAQYPHQLDLGQAWKDLTGLPFVYAVWMCRAADVDQPWISAAAAVLDRQRRHNATRLEWLVNSRAPERGWPLDQAARYVGSCLTYEVGDAEREAVRQFLDMAVEMGLAGSAEVVWADCQSGNWIMESGNAP